MDASTWDTRYASAPALWSAQPNRTLVERCPPVPVGGGRALDLGCGEGADTRWLSAEGWRATGVDFSVVAIERARMIAEQLPPPRPRYAVADVRDPAALSALSDDGLFELVTACYHHPQPEDRVRTYRHLPGLVADRGHLLLLAHHPEQRALEHEHVHEQAFTPDRYVGSGPEPRAGSDCPDPSGVAGSGPDPERLLTPEDILEALGPGSGLDLVTAEVVRRTDAEGRTVALDSLVLLRRPSASG